MIRVLALAVSFGLAACAPAPRTETMTDDLGCGDGKVARLVGKVWAESMRDQVMKTSGARTLRVIAPDTVVTMDFRPDRLNVETDAQGRIIRFKCG
ncbi:hypothetical protein QE379_002246 [Sphingomonas sp. SORGH_AS 879]|nr:hypothetical protein [Sphingomonas sp. SORGH_AS_0879]